MENKIERHASEWIKKHPNATLKEAFVAGYWKSCDNWCRKDR